MPAPAPACQPSVTDATPARSGSIGSRRHSAPTPTWDLGPMTIASSPPIADFTSAVSVSAESGLNASPTATRGLNACDATISLSSAGALAKGSSSKSVLLDPLAVNEPVPGKYAILVVSHLKLLNTFSASTPILNGPPD